MIVFRETETPPIPHNGHFNYRTYDHNGGRRRYVFYGDDTPRILATFVCEAYPHMAMHISCPDVVIGIGNRVAESDPVKAFLAVDRDVLGVYPTFRLFGNDYEAEDPERSKALGRQPLPRSGRRWSRANNLGVDLYHAKRDEYLVRLEEAVRLRPPRGCMVCGEDGYRPRGWYKLSKCENDGKHRWAKTFLVKDKWGWEFLPVPIPDPPASPL